MKKLISLLFTVSLLAPLHGEEGFVSLYNGKDLTGWKKVNGDGDFHVDGECIVGAGKNVKSNTFLRTEKTYKNFDFRFEMKFDDLSGNSGMMFRGLQKPGEDGRVNGYQCEHDNGKDRAWTAGLYDEARRGWLQPQKANKNSTEAEKAAQQAFTEQGKKIMKWDDWNQIRILCEDKHIQIWINGEKRVDYTDEGAEYTPEGFFALQVHAGKSCNVRWRKLRSKLSDYFSYGSLVTMGFFKSLFNKITNRAEIEWDEVEAELIAADLGVKGSMLIIDELRGLGRKITANDVVEAARRHISKRLPDSSPQLVRRTDGLPCVVLVVGVNGVGKTTSAAKLAHWLEKQKHSVILAAADTYRAAAVEQLERWGERLHIPVVKGNTNADPSSVCFHAHQKAIASKADFLICDTAGRLHTKHNLMEELTKIRRVISKNDPTAPHMTLLAVDATTGSNALQQAKEFHKACPLDGLILTKMDGSGKGGIAVTIHEQLQIPPCFVGTGEEPDAFALFNKEKFLNEVI